MAAIRHHSPQDISPHFQPQRFLQLLPWSIPQNKVLTLREISHESVSGIVSTLSLIWGLGAVALSHPTCWIEWIKHHALKPGGTPEEQDPWMRLRGIKVQWYSAQMVLFIPHHMLMFNLPRVFCNDHDWMTAASCRDIYFTIYAAKEQTGCPKSTYSMHLYRLLAAPIPESASVAVVVRVWTLRFASVADHGQCPSINTGIQSSWFEITTPYLSEEVSFFIIQGSGSLGSPQFI